MSERVFAASSETGRGTVGKTPSPPAQSAATPLDVMVDVQKRQPRSKAEEHRQMARAAIRVALRHGATDKEIEAEYAVVKEVERDGK